MSILPKEDNQLILKRVDDSSEIDTHYFMICIYLCYMYQFQMAIYQILLVLGQSPFNQVSDFGLFYMMLVYSMYWMRLFQLYYSRLSIVEPLKAQRLISKIYLWFQLSKTNTETGQN